MTIPLFTVYLSKEGGLVFIDIWLGGAAVPARTFSTVGNRPPRQYAPQTGGDRLTLPPPSVGVSVSVFSVSARPSAARAHPTAPRQPPREKSAFSRLTACKKRKITLS